MHRVRLIVLAVLLAGCVAPWRHDASDPSAAAGLDRALAAPAATPSAIGGPSTDPGQPSGPGAGAPPDSRTAGGSGSSGDGGASALTGGGGSPGRRLALQPDAAGDAGPAAPAYADLLSIELVDTGAGLRATVVAGGQIPRTLDDGQSAGIGIDLFVKGGTESDYQIFLEGSVDGWFAYLETPAGLQQYPGSFELAGDRFVVVVPWDALGGTRRGQFSVFSDWSSSVVAVALSSEDHAPDRSRAPYA